MARPPVVPRAPPFFVLLGPFSFPFSPLSLQTRLCLFPTIFLKFLTLLPFEHHGGFSSPASYELPPFLRKSLFPFFPRFFLLSEAPHPFFLLGKAFLSLFERGFFLGVLLFPFLSFFFPHFPLPFSSRNFPSPWWCPSRRHFSFFFFPLVVVMTRGSPFSATSGPPSFFFSLKNYPSFSFFFGMRRFLCFFFPLPRIKAPSPFFFLCMRSDPPLLGASISFPSPANPHPPFFSPFPKRKNSSSLSLGVHGGY